MYSLLLRGEMVMGWLSSEEVHDSGRGHREYRKNLASGRVAPAENL
jgi:hypothetical protein